MILRIYRNRSGIDLVQPYESYSGKHEIEGLIHATSRYTFDGCDGKRTTNTNNYLVSPSSV
ncbi:unnamed protein product [Brugia pahangi]|uniref:Pept_C1 domain-containing protein n=1 Tax=Brugia pahangi TaxID=6280 RepID=A0A0N4TIX6_BRUPA|nr:unnamed protein product [Brugia pahangi]